jgi:hypothetical protein
MSVQQEEKWITGEEFGTERRRLIAEGVPDDDPRFRALFARVHARDDYLYERYGKHHRSTHEGKWIGVSLDGEVIFGDRPGELIAAGNARFGPGNWALRKLAEFPGHEFHR